MQSASATQEAKSADERQLDKAESLLADLLELTEKTTASIARELPTARGPALSSSLSSSSSSSDLEGVAIDYLRKVSEVQDILSAQIHHVVASKTASTKITYANRLDAKLAALDSEFFSQKLITEKTTSKKRKRDEPSK